MVRIIHALPKTSRIFRSHPTVVWCVLAGLTLSAAIYRETSRASSNERPLDQEESVDTFIPAGFVLVPIEVLNYESLDSVLGRFGVVDLYSADPSTGKKAEKVASRIRILRAPRNPNQFAVLAPEEESTDLVKDGSGYFVVVQNPKLGGTVFEKRTPVSRKRNRILVESPNE